MKWDRELFRFVNDLEAPGLDTFAAVLSSEAMPLTLVGLYGLWALLAKRMNHIKLILWVGLSVAVTDFVAFRILKPGFARPRPCYVLSEVNLVATKCGGDYGFPSNHAANGMTAATMFFLVFRGRSPLRQVQHPQQTVAEPRGAHPRPWRNFLICLPVYAPIVLALLVGLSRIKVGVHYPGDVVAGWFLAGFPGWFHGG